MQKNNSHETKAAVLLLFIIYLAFIGLGLPDALLGSAWPVMRGSFGAELGLAGLVSMVVAGGTIVSSINSGKLINRLGTGKLTLISCILTAGALFGISVAPAFGVIVLLAIPLGLGAGAVDSGLNHFVANNYKVHHMNWLHAFWGIGATTGPLIMLRFLSFDGNWRGGYLTVACIQFFIVLLLFLSLNLWNKVEEKNHPMHMHESEQNAEASTATQENVFQVPGVKYTLAVFFLYCSVEMIIGLWGASYLVEVRGMVSKSAAGWISVYFGGITVGRILTGFISFRLSNRRLILLGQSISLIGGLALFIPSSIVFAKLGLLLLGLGLAPIFPGLIHETPARFGKHNSAKLIGYQMASAYVGITFMPPLTGLIASFVSMRVFPVIVIVVLGFMTLCSERIIQILHRKL